MTIKNKTGDEKEPVNKKNNSWMDSEFISAETVSKTLKKERIEEVSRRHEPMPVLTVIEGPEIGQHIVITPEHNKIVVGRLPEVDFIIDDESISRRHASINIAKARDGRIVVKIEDMESTNGTFVNGERVKRAKINDGDKIHFGDILVRFDQMDPLDARFQKMLAERAAAARYDPLTGLLSKRYFLEDMPGLVAFYAKKEMKLSLIMADIDHFKKINDTYGHQNGDKVLKIISEQILSAVRHNDLVVRYGGEEILLLLRSDFNGARHIVERIRKAISGGDYDIVSPGLKVTVSFGISILNKNDSLETLIERADKALYRAKNAGRNCVKWET